MVISIIIVLLDHLDIAHDHRDSNATKKEAPLRMEHNMNKYFVDLKQYLVDLKDNQQTLINEMVLMNQNISKTVEAFVLLKKEQIK